jgi:hypothetical protein
MKVKIKERLAHTRGLARKIKWQYKIMFVFLVPPLKAYGEWKCSSTLSFSLHEMEMCAQLHASAALPPASTG